MFKIAHAMENQHMDRALINILLRMQLVELVRSLWMKWILNKKLYHSITQKMVILN